ncbi:hypothetical protein [Microbacterium sp. 2MCAF23]|uniref:hypothetical protein n=1 Tax=Microbacterium sp. 2MCAF23 TaxID=3232985 RepID=UPI003F99C7FC
MFEHAPTTEHVRPARVGPAFFAVYVLAMFDVWMAISLPEPVTLALRISQIGPEGKATSHSIAPGVGWLVSGTAVMAVAAVPLFGIRSE